MKETEFGYFGSGDTGYAQYMTAFERSFGSTDSGTDEDAGDDFSAQDAADDSDEF